MRAALLAIVLAGCTTAATDDGEAELAPPQPVGKADSAQHLGLYASHATHHYDGDIPALELRGDGQFVRERCYHASCAIETPETDTFDEYTSSSGHTYVRFYGEDIGRDADGNLTDNRSIADVYEIRGFSKGVQVRKAYSSRWQSLYTTTVPLTFTTVANESNCDDSLGMWTDDDATLIGSYCICSIGEYLDATGRCTAL